MEMTRDLSKHCASIHRQNVRDSIVKADCTWNVLGKAHFLLIPLGTKTDNKS